MVADDAEVGQVGGCDGAAAVVGEALVALWWCQRCEGEGEQEELTSMLSYQYAFMIAIRWCCGGMLEEVLVVGLRNSAMVSEHVIPRVDHPII